MSAVKSGSSLRSLLLTPERIPHFLIPSRSPLLTLSPQPYRRSLDRTRLLSDHDEDSPGGSPPEVPLSPAASPRFLLRLPPRIKAPRRAAAAAAEDANAGTDLTTRAAMSLPHVEKVTTPYGFRAVLAASPCTHRRESMFHRNKPVTVAVTDNELQDPGLRDPSDPPPLPSRSRICLRPIKALGLQVMRELKRPAASLKALSPRARKTR